MSDFWKNWAQRRISRGVPQGEEAPTDQAVVPAPVPAVVPTQALPPPPPGFVYVPNPQYGFVLVPAGQPAPMVPPPRQPGHAPPAIPQVRVEPVRTCELVRPGDKDPYAELLNQVPEIHPTLVGASGTDDVTNKIEYQNAMSNDNRAYPQQGKGAVAFRAHGDELKS